MKATAARTPKDVERVYQVRMEKGSGPEELLDGLTWTVWRVVSETRGPACLDQHRWPELRQCLQKILANRLVRYGQCGKRTECGAAPGKVFWPAEARGKPPSEIHILEVKGGIDRLLEEIGVTVELRFAKALSLPLKERRPWRIDLRRQLQASLSDTLYYSPRCQDCAARKDFRERRLWDRP